MLHCQVLGTKFSIRNLGPYLRCLLRFYLEDCHSDDSGVRARTRAGPRAEIYERPVLVRFWIFWTLVSTQQLQGRYLRDFCRQRRWRRDLSSIPYTTVCDRAPRTRRPVFRPSAFGCFWIFWPQIFMFQLLGCCLMVFCGENHMVRESCFWQKKFRTSSGDTLVLNSVCVTTVRATPGGTPIIWKVGHVANHYFSLVRRILLQFFALLAQLPYCLFPLRFFCFFDRRFSRSGFRRFSGVRQRKIPRFHGSKIRPSKILSESIEIWHAGRLWCQASFSWTHSFNLEPFLFYWRLRSANLAIFGSVCENRP